MAAPTYETIRIDREGAVDWLVLNRPEALNAINYDDGPEPAKEGDEEEASGN